MKVHQLLESEGSLIETLIKQLLNKQQVVKLDFTLNGLRYTGQVSGFMNHTLYAFQEVGGQRVPGKVTLPERADELFTLRKVDGVWTVQNL